MAGMDGWRYSPPKVACGVAIADCSPPESRIPDDPPYRSICCWCISSTSSSERKRGSMRLPAAPLLGQLFESLPVPFVRPLLCGVELLPPSEGFPGRRDDETRAIRADVQRCFRVDPQQIQDRSVDDQRQAIAVFGELFEHKTLRTPYLQCYTNVATDETARCRSSKMHQPGSPFSTGLSTNAEASTEKPESSRG